MLLVSHSVLLLVDKLRSVHTPDKSRFVHRPEEVQALISGKLALRYAGRQVSLLSCPFLSGLFEDCFPVRVQTSPFLPYL